MVIGNCEKNILYIRETNSYQAKPPLQCHLLASLNSLWQNTVLIRLCNVQDINPGPVLLLQHLSFNQGGATTVDKIMKIIEDILSLNGLHGAGDA